MNIFCIHFTLTLYPHTWGGSSRWKHSAFKSALCSCASCAFLANGVCGKWSFLTVVSLSHLQIIVGVKTCCLVFTQKAGQKAKKQASHALRSNSDRTYERGKSKDSSRKGKEKNRSPGEIVDMDCVTRTVRHTRKWSTFDTIIDLSIV